MIEKLMIILLKGAASKDKSNAEDIFCDKYTRYIFDLVFGFWGNSEDADDITQEILTKLLKIMPDFKEDCALTTFVYRVAVNYVIDWMRKNKPHINLTVPHALDEDGNVINEPQDPGTPEITYNNKALGERIAHAEGQLEGNNKLCYDLNKDNRNTNQDIADITGLTLATVKTSIHLARLFLRKILKPDYDEMNGN